MTIKSISELAEHTDFSLLDSLNADPQASDNGDDFNPRQVFSGHYVPVKPTPIAEPEYVIHSKTFFEELGLDDSLATTEAFKQVFSGDLSNVPKPMRSFGWATGYALSIYGTEYQQQCPFGTGNGYGDGRAMSIIEAVLNNKRWEMQLKGGGRTPYCRGADGRAVLRSSVREFLAQEHMHALGASTSRSLSLFVSKAEQVDRPWYLEDSQSTDPEIMVSNPVAITTRVAPSFLRVGQIELFARRTRKQEYPEAVEELELIVKHLIDREYGNEISAELPLEDKIIALASAFRERLTSLITTWLRVGYCQGNFNGDNCAAGGFTLDYGPFGFCEMFDPYFQPWTGGGRHFSFLNQPLAAEQNFNMFCASIKHLLAGHPEQLEQLEQIRSEFSQLMTAKLEAMWASKLGIPAYDSELFIQLLQLMMRTAVDYTIFFRELSALPDNIKQLSKSFYEEPSDEILAEWVKWLHNWRARISQHTDLDSVSEQMKQVNPKYTWREWLIVPAYQNAAKGDYTLIQELQAVLANPYEEQSKDIEKKYYRLRPSEFMRAGGVSHYSCSS